MASDREPNWQPISALAVVAALIDGQLEDHRHQYRLLVEAAVRPYRLDDATVASVRRVYTDAADDLSVYDEQLARWARQDLTPAQAAEVARLAAVMTPLHDAVAAILALAAELQDQTIERLLEQTDLEVGLDWLLRGDGT